MRIQYLPLNDLNQPEDLAQYRHEPIVDIQESLVMVQFFFKSSITSSSIRITIVVIGQLLSIAFLYLVRYKLEAEKPIGE